MPDPLTFRAQSPVLSEYAYLNAGTEGPVPQAAADAAAAQLDGALREGRIGSRYFDTVMELAAAARSSYARVLGARSPDAVALTSSTTGGVNAVLGGLRFEPGNVVLTSDQEHPGLLAPLRRLAIRSGVTVQVAPFARIAEFAGPQTALIACSHVSWVGGEVVDAPALVATGVPVLLDAAQALGAIPVDVTALGVDYYAASGQKWLCGPEGSGCLYVRPDALDRIEPPAPGYSSVADTADVLASALAPTTARLDDGFPTAIRSAWAHASLRVFDDAGWDWVHARATGGADTLAQALIGRGLSVAPRGASTLVSWTPPGGRDVADEVIRLAADGIVVRSIPSHGLLRASVGAWTTEAELARLVDAAAS